MLTPLQALLSALLTASIVQYLSIKLAHIENKVTTARIIDRTVPKTLLLPTSSIEDEPPEVNKLLDAIFVSHGIEAETNEDETPATPEKREILILNESNFPSIYTGDWLILEHVPWFPSAKEYLNHFTSEFASIPQSASSINFAVLDCDSHPLLAASLNVRQYPSLHLVTQSGRLREWPFQLKPLDQDALKFILNGHWKHLPVYQLLKPIEHKQQLLLSFIQIKAFNAFTSTVMKLQPKIFNWVVKNRPLTGGILSSLTLSTFLLTRKLQNQ